MLTTLTVLFMQNEVRVVTVVRASAIVTGATAVVEIVGADATAVVAIAAVAIADAATVGVATTVVATVATGVRTVPGSDVYVNPSATARAIVNGITEATYG